MTPLSRCLTGAAIILSFATPSFARDQRRDAQAFPCTQRDQLVVKQDGQGFAIIRRGPDATAQTPPLDPVGPPILVGTSLAIDRSIFAADASSKAEYPDARR